MIDLRALAALVERHGDDLDLPVTPFRVGEREIDTDARPALMGIVNLSQDSWYRESIAADRADAVRRAKVQAAQGADFVDLGAESVVTTTARVAADEQTAQLAPVIAELTEAGVDTSVESYHPSTVEACLAAGARVVNLTGSVDDEAVFSLAAAHGASVVLCHIAGANARDLDEQRDYDDDPVPAMLDHFGPRVELAQRLGVASVAVDPGVGFTTPWLTSVEQRARFQSMALLHSFRLRSLGVPVCHALPAAMHIFGEEVRIAEPFFAVLASLGRTGVVRTHEIPRIRAVTEALATFEADHR